jgi:hypothetical protein
MRIIKNWFYKLSELNSVNITIEDNLVVVIFDDIFLTSSLFENVLSNWIMIDIWENSRVEFYWVIENTSDFKINFLQNKESSNLIVKYLLLSKNNDKVKAKIFSQISASNTKTDIHIISIVWNDWFVDLDWIIEIDKWIQKVDAKLVEENIFLWNNWKVKWIPTLLVRSNDVKASHACKMERISDEKLFYLRSRWIWRENALFMLVESYISSMFMCLSMIDETFYKELFENIIKKIKL